MATLVLSLIRLISILLLFSSTAVSRHHIRHTSTGTSSSSSSSSSISPLIRQSCAATRYPSTCESQLTKLPSNPTTPPEVILSALNVSARHLKTAESMVQSILSASSSNLNRSRAAALCLNLLSYSARRSSASAQALLSSSIKDARAWAGAALVYQYDCWSGLKYVNGTAAVNSTMSFFDTTLIVATSNALSMMLALDAFGNDPASWSPPRTERDGFWPPPLPARASASGSGFGGPGFWEGLYIRANVTVCKGQGGDPCDYETVQAAVDAAERAGGGGKRRFVVRIREGVYKETVRVGIQNTNLVFLGDGIGKTVITASLNAGMPGVTTYATATVGVLGDGFMAYNLTIENTAGPDTHQAVAFTSDSDLSYVENCEFLGNQDTLYAHSLRQLYRSCRMEGNVDFIFGNSAAVFHNCTILIRPRQRPNKGETNAVSAHGRTDPAQPTGFSFLGCVVNGTEDYMKAYYSKPTVHKNYLGRPWKTYSRTVFIGSTLGEIIHPAGWLPWDKDVALSTLYYGEYGNQGPGAALDKRVPWSSQIPAEHVGAYSIENFIQGDEFSMPKKQRPSKGMMTF